MGDESLRLSDVERGRDLRFTFDGDVIVAREGETIAAALLASGRRVIRHTPRSGAPRGLFCSMGVCFDCVVTIGASGVRACVVPVTEGLIVTSAPA